MEKSDTSEMEAQDITDNMQNESDIIGKATDKICGEVNEIKSVRIDSNNDQQQKVGYKYTFSDTGPFFVVTKSLNDNINKIHPMKIGKWLYINNFSVLQILKTGFNQMEVHFSSANQANRFLDSDFDLFFNTKSFIPYYNLYTNGVIKKIDKDISIEEIVRDIKIPDGIKLQSAYRLQYRHVNELGEPEYLPSNKVKLTFRSQRLPNYVSLYFERREVEHFVERVIQCRKCGKYNHKTKFCKSEGRCLQCAGSHLTETCTTVPQCINCGQSHLATDKEHCPTYQLENNILKTVSELPVSKYQAKQIVKGTTSYADILRKQSPTDNPLTDFPPLCQNNIMTDISSSLKQNYVDNRSTSEIGGKRKCREHEKGYDSTQHRAALLLPKDRLSTPKHFVGTSTLVKRKTPQEHIARRKGTLVHREQPFSQTSPVNIQILSRFNDILNEAPDSIRRSLEVFKETFLIPYAHQEILK